jgi:uncharacterized heparinase superfamily protein
MRIDETMRLARTVAQLRPGQISRRLQLRGQHILLRRWPPSRGWLLAGPDPAGEAGWPAGFVPADAPLWRDWPGRAALASGEMSLLGVTRTLAPADGNNAARWADADWEMADTPRLWRFHLHDWDWAWALAADSDLDQARALFGAIWPSWLAATVPGHGEAWHPYPAALRAWSWCGIYRPLAEGTPAETAFRTSLAAHAGFLRRNLETDVGGNHLIKNLKALAGLAVYFSDEALLAWSLTRLSQQLSVQILPDGGHFERAPAYHCQVLGDLIDLAALLAAAGHNEPDGLTGTIEAMRAWLGVVLTPAGEVPLLNDGFPVSHELLATLKPATPPAEPLVVLPDTGLVRATAGNWHLLADIGLPCPGNLPAHAHADTLACLVHVDSAPLLVDTGTSTYAPGDERDRERSTAAHNTLTVDERNSTEVWGAFRAGRRARISGVTAQADDGPGLVTIEAAHDGYRNLRGRPRHRRRWSLTEDELAVDDLVTGRGRHRIELRWHLAPEAQLRLIPGGALISTKAGDFQVSVTASTPPALRAGGADISSGFARTTSAPVLTCALHPQLPVQITTVWRGPLPDRS